jgi:CBS domain-containing protein
MLYRRRQVRDPVGLRIHGVHGIGVAAVDPPVRTTVDTPPHRIVDVMGNLVATVDADDEPDVAIDMMWSRMAKSLPVTHQGRVVGMISRSDVIAIRIH